MRFTALREFIAYLEKSGELHRVKAEVDPVLEITEIAVRSLREGKPALLFENVKGSTYPLAINVLASERRIELALGEHPDSLGERLITFFEQAVPPTTSSLIKHRRTISRFLSARTSDISIAPSQEVVQNPNLSELPIIQCWPQDGGRFITLPQVVSYDPRSGKRNIGMYRMHVFDGRTTGMHWQIQKGGGFHFFQSMKLDRPLEVAVALGTDPALLMATVAPLPEGIDEAMFAGFLRKKSTQLVGGRSISINVPANAEFILEGIVPPKERRMEGPFGDHFGHYSAAAEFPVFHITAMTHRRNPIYPATVVGIPPMEDKFLGDATQRILGPLARILHTEVKGLWAYYEAGFHNLLAVSIEERYQKEGMKTALGLMGTQQLSLTKCLITVPEDVDPRDFPSVLRAVRENFDPHYDFILLPKVPLDTLDFTSYKMNLGSKMILDATKKQRPPSRFRIPRKTRQFISQLPQHDRRILDTNIAEDALLIVKVKYEGGAVLKRLLRSPLIDGIRVLAVVSPDVDIHRQEAYIWGIFTRFDCERDVQFREQKLVGISPVYHGTLGIDATWKPGYPDPLVMDEKIVARVDRRWDEYWK